MAQMTLEEVVRDSGIGEFLGECYVRVADYAEHTELLGFMGKAGLLHYSVDTSVEEKEDCLLVQFERNVFEVKQSRRPPLPPGILDYMKPGAADYLKNQE